MRPKQRESSLTTSSVATLLAAVGLSVGLVGCGGGGAGTVSPQVFAYGVTIETMGFSKSSQKMYCREVEENKPNGTELRYSQHNVGADSRKSRWKLFRLVVCTDDEDRSPEPLHVSDHAFDVLLLHGARVEASHKCTAAKFQDQSLQHPSAGECGC